MIGVRARKEAALAGAKSNSLPKTPAKPPPPAVKPTPKETAATTPASPKAKPAYVKKPPKKLTAAELAEKTKDYVLTKDYTIVKVGTYIRYIDMSGGYHQGGYVLSNKDGKILIGTSLGIAKIKWTMKYENIEKLFYRKQTDTVVLSSQIDGLNEMVGALVQYMKVKDGKKFIEFVKNELANPTKQ